MANVNVAIVQISPMGGTSKGGLKLGYLDSAAKAGATDTWTITNAKTVEWASLTNDTSGALDPITSFSTNVITGSVGTGTTSGLILYR